MLLAIATGHSVVAGRYRYMQLLTPGGWYTVGVRMTQIVDHGKWVLYQPDTLPEHAPLSALFARRESDGVDWYVYSRDSKNFSPDTVKFTVMWQDTHNGFIIGAATRDPTRLFPAGQLLREIIDYHGGGSASRTGSETLRSRHQQAARSAAAAADLRLPGILRPGSQRWKPSWEARHERRLRHSQYGLRRRQLLRPAFSYNPQMSAGQASAAYMPRENYAQNVTNNLFSSGGAASAADRLLLAASARNTAPHGMSPYGGLQ